MSNPVMNRLSTDWQRTTPAGYPTMPGYQVGQPVAVQNAPAPGYSTPSVDMRDFEHAYTSPSADAVDRGTMTYDDVIVRSGTLLGLLLIAAAAAWVLGANQPGLSALFMGVGFIGAFVLAMVNSFSKTIRPALIMAYAALEGLGLGAFSMLMDARYPGIVVQALIGTAAVFAVTLGLFSSGKVRNSSKLMKFTLIGMLGIIVYRLLSLVLVWTGVISTGFDHLTIMGIPMGFAVGALAVVLGAISLIGDFDVIQRGVNSGAPARFAWMAAFGLMVTVVWMYMEILRILSYFRD